MSWELIEEDTLYKEEITYTDPYTLRGVYYAGEESIEYKTILGTVEPYRDGEEAMVLPSGTSASDARVLYSSEPLLTYDDAADISIADKVYLTNPEVGKTTPQRFVVMNKENWTTNSGFTLIDTDDAITYLLIKEEKAISNGV